MPTTWVSFLLAFARSPKLASWKLTPRSGERNKQALAYDPQADNWQVVGTRPEQLLAAAAAIISGRLIVTGGCLNNPRPLTANTRIALLPTNR